MSGEMEPQLKLWKKVVKRHLKAARPRGMTRKAIVSAILLDGHSNANPLEIAASGGIDGKDDKKARKKRVKRGVTAALEAFAGKGKVQEVHGGKEWTWSSRSSGMTVPAGTRGLETMLCRPRQRIDAPGMTQMQLA